MNYKPEDFHGLSKEEAEEMKALFVTRKEYDHFQFCCAHGALCTAMMSMGRAKVYFAEHRPETAAVIGNAMASLGGIIPSYEDFSRVTSRPRRVVL